MNRRTVNEPKDPGDAERFYTLGARCEEKKSVMDDDDFISKTRRKKQATELQDVGRGLVKLSREQLARVDMPEQLREAVLECKRLTTHEAIRRQVQHIGKVMRGLDAGPIAAQLAAMHAPSNRDTALFHLAENWRQEMLEDHAAIDRFVREFPAAEPLGLRNLVEAAKAERDADKAPRKFRELFHVLNAFVQGQARKP